MSQTLQATYAAKRKARRFAVQGIYEWQMSHVRVWKMPCTKWI
jgi:transcription antitermination protein NusB